MGNDLSLICARDRKEEEARGKKKHKVRRSWDSGPLLQMPHEVLLRIEWASASGSSGAGDLCSLALCCYSLSERLQRDDPEGTGNIHPLWGRKLQGLLGQGRWGNRAPFPPNAGLSSRQQCIWLLVMVRLLGSAVTSCDWMALVDIEAMLATARIRGVGAVSVTFHCLMAKQPHAPTLQGIHWLWDLAAGHSQPWARGYSSRPTQEVVQLDRLRRWLHENVSEVIVPWHDHTEFAVEQSYGSLFDVATRARFQASSVILAAFSILAIQCSSPVPSGLEAAVPLAELALFLEGSLKSSDGGEDDNRPGQLRWRVATLLLLARCLSSVTGSQCYSALSDEGSVGWRGLCLHWRVGSRNNLNLQDDLKPLHFPDLWADERWLHSQRGIQVRTAQSGPPPLVDPPVVQFDAKWDRDTHSYLGEWMDAGLGVSLPVRLFVLEPAWGGLLRWIVKTTKESLGHRDIGPEVLGVIGGPNCHACGVLHISRPPSMSSNKLRTSSDDFMN